MSAKQLKRSPNIFPLIIILILYCVLQKLVQLIITAPVQALPNAAGARDAGSHWFVVPTYARTQEFDARIYENNSRATTFSLAKM